MKFSHLNRIYTDKFLAVGNNIVIADEDFHYLKSVMRLKCSDCFRIFNPINGEFLARIIKIGKRDLSIEIDILLREVASEPPLTLAICIIKPDRIIEAIKGAVQLGVTRIVPIISERTQFRSIQHDRITRCIRQSIEQSERFEFTELMPEISLSDFCESNSYNQIIVAFESESSDSKIRTIKSIEDNAAILIGPEGGFSDQEIEVFKNNPKMELISLGNSVLRSEIAAIAAISCVMMCK